MSGTMGAMRDIADVRHYVSVCLDKVELSFGGSIKQPSHGFVPYKAVNTALVGQIEEYFQKNRAWKDMKISSLESEFSDDYWSIFHYVGWEGLYRLTPLLISLAYEGYFVGDEICLTVENLFSKFPRESDDNSMSFLEWMALYDQYQIMCVLDMMTLIGNDPLNLYPDGFREGRRWWTRYYLDGPSS